MIGQWCAGRLPAGEAFDRYTERGGLADGNLGGDLVLGGGGDQIFELQLELVDQVLLAFGGLRIPTIARMYSDLMPRSVPK